MVQKPHAHDATVVAPVQLPTLRRPAEQPVDAAYVLQREFVLTRQATLSLCSHSPSPTIRVIHQSTSRIPMSRHPRPRSASSPSTARFSSRTSRANLSPSRPCRRKRSSTTVFLNSRAQAWSCLKANECSVQPIYEVYGRETTPCDPYAANYDPSRSHDWPSAVDYARADVVHWR